MATPYYNLGERDIFSSLPRALTIYTGDLDLLENDEYKLEKWFLYYKIMTLHFPICNNLPSNLDKQCQGREAEQPPWLISQLF